MVIRRFYFEGKDSKVIGVGLRPSIVNHATSKYNLRAVAHNIIGKTPDQNRVEVIVEGKLDSINMFYDDVSKNDIRKKQEGSMPPKVSKLESYKGRPDWNYCLNTINVEQMDKGIDVLSGIHNDTKEMKTDFKEMKTDLKEMKDAFVKLNDNITTIGGSFVEMIERYGIFGEKMDKMLELQGDAKERLDQLSYLKDIRDLLQKQNK